MFKNRYLYFRITSKKFSETGEFEQNNYYEEFENIREYLEKF